MDYAISQKRRVFRKFRDDFFSEGKSDDSFEATTPFSSLSTSWTLAHPHDRTARAWLDAALSKSAADAVISARRQCADALREEASLSAAAAAAAAKNKNTDADAPPALFSAPAAPSSRAAAADAAALDRLAEPLRRDPGARLRRRAILAVVDAVVRASAEDARGDAIRYSEASGGRVLTSEAISAGSSFRRSLAEVSRAALGDYEETQTRGPGAGRSEHSDAAGFGFGDSSDGNTASDIRRFGGFGARSGDVRTRSDEARARSDEAHASCAFGAEALDRCFCLDLDLLTFPTRSPHT